MEKITQDKKNAVLKFVCIVFLVGMIHACDKQAPTESSPATAKQTSAVIPTTEQAKPAAVQNTVSTSDKKAYSSYAGRKFPTNVYFGDTHLHTRLSLDAYGDGNTKNGPTEAYR